MNNIRKVDHPLLKNLIFKLRDKQTPSNLFRQTVSAIAKILLMEALRDEKTDIASVETPLEKTDYYKLDEDSYIIVAILRAGLPMLEGCLDILPGAKSGFLGIKRDEKTLESFLYYKRLPDIRGRNVIIVDPMIATGGSLSLAIDYLKSDNPKKIKSLHILASPDGIEKLAKYSNVEFYIGEIDRALNSKGYIVPGIGDAGDRAFNTDD